MDYDSQNIFARILRGELPAIKLYEDEHTLAFMDIMPQVEGHCLVIPKEASKDVFDLTPEAAAACLKTVQKVGSAVKKAFNTEGIVLLQLNGEQAGQTVPHYHIHVMPTSIQQIKVVHAQQMADQQQLQQLAQRIIDCLD